MQSLISAAPAASGRIRCDAPPVSALFARPLFATHHIGYLRHFTWYPTLIHVVTAIPGGEDIVVRCSPAAFTSQLLFARRVLSVTGWPMPMASRAAWAATVAELLRRGRE